MEGSLDCGGDKPPGKTFRRFFCRKTIVTTTNVDNNIPAPTQPEIDLVRDSWESVSQKRHPDDEETVSPTHAFGLAFYDALFGMDSDLKLLFTNIFQQARALTGMISYITQAPAVAGPSPCPFPGKKNNEATTIREINARKRARQPSEEGDPARIVRQLRELGARHYYYNVHPEQLSLVGPAFVEALKVRLGDEYTDEIGDAWLSVRKRTLILS